MPKVAGGGHTGEIAAGARFAFGNNRLRFFPGHDRWRIVEGSVLDELFLGRLGTFDTVSSRAKGFRLERPAPRC